VNGEITNGLEVLAYLFLGTVGITLLVTWLLKQFGPHKK